MNALDDLRRTLDAHADRAGTAVGVDLTARTASIHRRVHRTRRRRRAAVAGAAAAVVAVVGGVALLPGAEQQTGPQPASVVGVDVPETMQSLGYTYRLTETVEGDGGSARVRLPASDQPRLVSWATSGDAAEVRVANRGTAYRTSVPDFGDRVYVDPGDASVVSVSAEEGTPGLAVYEVDPAAVPPEGVSARGITFRQEVHGRQLLAASIGEPGQSEVSVDTVATSGSVDVVAVCFGGEGTTVLRNTFRTGAGCGGAAPFDAATSTRGGYEVAPGDRVRETVSAMERGTGQPAADDDLVIALAVYAGAPETSGLPQVTEAAGRRWRLLDTTGVDGTSIDAVAPAGDRAVLAAVDLTWSGTATAEVDFGSGAASRVGSTDIGVSGGGGAQVVSPGQRVTARMVEGGAATLRIGFYEPID